MKKLINILGAIVLVVSANAQGDIRLESGFIVITGNTTVNVPGDVQFDNGTSSEINGNLFLSNNWINNSGGTALSSSSIGKVILSGNTQDITGSDATMFYDLELLNSSAVKTTLVNTFIKNTLFLNDAILQTDAYLTHVTNPAVNSVQWNGGYIESNDISGYLLRSTNSKNTYSYPLGNVLLDNTYRPVEVNPKSSDSSVFGVRLGVINSSFLSGVSAAGSIAPFDLSSKEVRLGDLNDEYQHNIHRFSGTAEATANLLFFKTDEQNGIFSTAAKWSTVEGKWMDDYFRVRNLIPKPEYNNVDKVATSVNVLSYDDDVYTLNNLNIILSTTFTPNMDGFNDVFEIIGLEYYPNNKIEIFNRWGELVYSASPYLNDWDGTNNNNNLKFQGDKVQEDTYFYILTLDKKSGSFKNYVEVIRD